MLPGIIPSLLMAGSPPIYDAYVDPGSAAWFGSIFNYYTDLYAQHSGGTAPFTYNWSSDGFVLSIDDPTSRLARFRSNDGSGAAVQCAIRDATGQLVVINGTILGVSGGLG